MKINNLGYLIKEGFRGIFLHGFMSFAAICVTIACLLIVGSFSILAYNLDVMVQKLNQTSEIMVYVDSSLSDAEARSIGTKINALDNVEKSVFISREDALQSFVNDHNNNAAFNGVQAQDLRHRYVVTLEDNNQMKKTDEQLKQIPGVAKTNAAYELAEGFITIQNVLNLISVALIAMLVCAAFGTVTGFFIAYLNVPPFIATLAMMEIVYGIGLIVTNATPLGGYVEQYTNVSNGKFLGINYLIWIAIIVAAITWFIFNMTRHGKYMYAIGGNPQAAEVAGVPVKATLILIYMKAAAMYGLAGFMLGAKAGGASVQTGYGYEMEAIAACTIGGVSVTGGRGKVSSAIIGVAVFELLKVALQYLGMNANAQYIAIGVVIFIAISLDIRKYIARK